MTGHPLFSAAERTGYRLIFAAMAAGLVLATALADVVLPFTGPGYLAFLAAAIPALATAFMLGIAALSAGDTAESWRKNPPPGWELRRPRRMRERQNAGTAECGNGSGNTSMSIGDSPAIRAALGIATTAAQAGQRLTIRTGPQDPACPLPGCGQPLYLIRSLCVPIQAGDTPEQLNSPSAGISTDWRVECEDGHVVLLPPDTGEDCYSFGLCTGAPHDEADQPMAVGECACTDMDRLAALGPPQAAPKGSYLGVYRDDKRGATGRLEDEHSNDLPGALAAFTTAVTDSACQYATLEYLRETGNPVPAHTGDQSCSLRPLHDPCHTGCSEDGR